MKRVITLIISLVLLTSCEKAREPEQISTIGSFDVSIESAIEVTPDIAPETATENMLKRQYSLSYNNSSYYPAHSPDVDFVGELLYYHEVDSNYIPIEPSDAENPSDPFIPPPIPGDIGYSVYEVKDVSLNIAVIVKLDDEEGYLTYVNLSPPSGSVVAIVENWDRSELVIGDNETEINRLLDGVDTKNVFGYANNPYGNLGGDILFAAFYSADTGINYIMYVYDGGYLDISIGFYADTIISKIS